MLRIDEYFGNGISEIFFNHNANTFVFLRLLKRTEIHV